MTRTEMPVTSDNLQNFLRAYSNVFEHSPWMVERAWALRPYADGKALYAAFCHVLHSLTQEDQLRLIAAHPELADRAAIATGMTGDSIAEQASVGLDRLTAQEFDAFQTLNDAYRRAHGFPFIICARLYDKEGILAAMRQRLARSSEDELREAIGQISQICRFRLEMLLAG